MTFSVGPPVLDLLPFKAASESNLGVQQEIIIKMQEACEQYGLFQVINHGVDAGLLRQVLQNGEQFFSLPLEEKTRYLAERPPFGYVHQSAVYGGPLERKEHVFGAMEDNPACIKNVWPGTPANFKKDMLELGKQMQTTAGIVLSLISRSLSLGENKLSRCYGKTGNYVNVIHYPAVSDYEGPVLAQHQDGTILTMVAQLNMVPGYQVWMDGKWCTVEPECDALIVNIGDLVQVSTNRHCKSALHRVVASKQERFSFVYNHVPAPTAHVSPLEEFLAKEPARYRSFVIGDYLELRFKNKDVNSKLGKEITIEHYAL